MEETKTGEMKVDETKQATPDVPDAAVPPLSMAKLRKEERRRAAESVMDMTFADRRDLESWLYFEGGATVIRWRHGCPPGDLWDSVKLGQTERAEVCTPRDPNNLEQVTRIVKAKLVHDGETDNYLCIFYNKTRVEAYVAAKGFETWRLEKALLAYSVQKEERMRVETARATGEQALLEQADEEARRIRAAEAEGAADAEA